MSARRRSSTPRPQTSAGRILIGHCDALSTPRPLGPLLDMAASGADRVGRALANGATRHELFDAMLDELASPVLAVIEDVHWADDSTVDLLRYLGRRITQTRAVLIVTFRTDEVESHPALRVALGDLASAPGSRRLAVAPLSVDGVRSIAQGHPLDPVRLHEVTGGNPFYVTEVLSTGAWSVPPTVSDAVLARASRLSVGVNTTVDIVAIEPSGMEWWLAEALGADPADIQSAVDAGVLSAVQGTLRFRHELARLAILARVRTDRRSALHRAALDMLHRARRRVRPGATRASRRTRRGHRRGRPMGPDRSAPRRCRRRPPRGGRALPACRRRPRGRVR